MKEGQGPRQQIERDIEDKIWRGDMAMLHLPARDVLTLYKMAKGEHMQDFAQEAFHKDDRTLTMSLKYLREVFDVEKIDHAFGMLVARGFSLPDDIVPDSSQARFTQKELEGLKLWVEGSSSKMINVRLHRARNEIGAKSNIQLVAAALKEGFLRYEKKDDGSFLFTTEKTPHPHLTARQKKILIDRFHDISEEVIGEELLIHKSNVQQSLAKARKAFKVNTTSQLLFRCLEEGQVSIDELVADFDLKKATELSDNQKNLIEKSIINIDTLESTKQREKAFAYGKGSLEMFEYRVISRLDVGTYLQAMVVYIAAVDKGIILPYEASDSSTLPSSADVFPPTQQ